MKINYPMLAILSVFVLFAGLILAPAVLAQASETQIVTGELTKVDAAAKTLSVKTSTGNRVVASALCKGGNLDRKDQ